MVDYSSQKPIQNPSYFKKPATKSQLTAGGDGGKGAALAANVAGASGQANQSVPGEDFLSGISKKLGFVPNVPISTQGMNTGTSQPGILSIEGGTTALANVSNRIFGSKEVQAQPISASSLLNQPGTNQYKQVSITPIAIQQLATKPLAQPIQKPTLGQFTTPTGGFAKINITPNQPISTQGTGLHQLTPDQQSYLQGQIDRNARPEVQAEFAKQAAIVNERMAEGKAWDAAHSNRLGDIESKFRQAQASGSPMEISQWSKILQKAYDNQGDADIADKTNISHYAIESQKLGYGAEEARQANELSAAKANVEDTANWQKLITSPEASTIPKPQLVTMALQRSQPLSLESALGEDIAKQVREESDPIAKKALVRSVLGDLTDLYINSQRSQQ